MALYLIAFNDEWVPDLTSEELRERGTSGRALIEEMTVAGVFVFSDGGLDASTVVCSVGAGGGSPLFSDGPYVALQARHELTICDAAANLASLERLSALALQGVVHGLHADLAVAEHERIDAIVGAGLAGIGGPF
jgi:hypothetical protein